MKNQEKTYRVLARQYRPTRLSDLVGQEIMVKTLLQALRDKRLPHALLLHGTRGVGKTTTARILAKILNCLQSDPGSQEPCGVCDACIAIADGRFLDVVEMDAASHTSVDDIREVIESSRYKAVVGRSKVYIIDEVHMLSKSAFNALLKTLEEPPPHVTFIFATTELRRVPETILSRCMRFDLKRMEVPALVSYLQIIAGRETITLEEPAAQLLAQAADGSMRDALSLLDQAIALAEGPITAETVRSMLGLANRQALLGLVQDILSGSISPALTTLGELFQHGTDPIFVTEGLLELVYHLTCLKTTPQSAQKLLWQPQEFAQAQAICKTIELPVLMQAWQVLSRGYEEVSRSILPNQALEMLLVRLAYLSPLPSAHDLLAVLQGVKKSLPVTPAVEKPVAAATIIVPVQEPAAAVGSPTLPVDFEGVIALIKEAREMMLYTHLIQDVSLVSYQPGEIVIRPTTAAPGNLGQQLCQILEKQTQQPWVIRLVNEGGEAPLAQQWQQRQAVAEQKSRDHPAVQAVLEAFPGAVATIQNQQGK
jgi:DNA polymerase-3 subunit gamma/tau